MVLLAMVLSACTIVGHEKVLGWPQMDIVAHYVPAEEMRTRCLPYVGFGMLPEACAEFNFAANRCDMWFNADFPPPAQVVEHEELHCKGYDHIGQRTMAEVLSRHLAEANASTGSTRR